MVGRWISLWVSTKFQGAIYVKFSGVCFISRCFPKKPLLRRLLSFGRGGLRCSSILADAWSICFYTLGAPTPKRRGWWWWGWGGGIGWVAGSVFFRGSVLCEVSEGKSSEILETYILLPESHWQDATVWEVMMKTQPNQWGKASLSYSSTFSCIQHLGSKTCAQHPLSWKHHRCYLNFISPMISLVQFTWVRHPRCGSHHVLAVVDYRQSSPPASEKLLSIKRLPPLQLTSCLPCDLQA